VAGLGLLSQAAVVPAGDRCRCGELWGGQCQTVVGPPDWSHGDHPDLRLARDAAKSAGTPWPVLMYLSASANGEIRLGVLGNPACPPAVLDVFQDGDLPRNMMEREAVGGNPAAPVRALQRLSWDSAWEVRRAVVRNPSCPPMVLRRLGQLTLTRSARRRRAMLTARLTF